MEVCSRKIGEFYIIDLPQDIFNNGNIACLKKVIIELVEHGAINILLNMKDIVKIDGIGLGALLSFQKVALFNKVNIRLYGLQPYVAQMMFQTRLNKVLDICQSEDDFEELISDSIMIA